MRTLVTLPHGLPQGDALHREAELRALDGEDESWLLDEKADGFPAERVTALLARCVTRLGDAAPATPEALRTLSVGDREALLLHLRRLSGGDRLPCVLRCPASGCGEDLEMDLRVQDLLLPPYADARPAHEETLEDDGATVVVRFRLPTGGDQEAVARLAARDPEAGAAALLERCILSIERDGRPLDARPPGLAERLGRRMAELDPQAELLVAMACPACGASSHALFDAAGYLLAELDAQARQLYREVHLLALHYHWSERDILALPPKRRATYLRLLDEAHAPEASG